MTTLVPSARRTKTVGLHVVLISTIQICFSMGAHARVCIYIWAQYPGGLVF